MSLGAAPDVHASALGTDGSLGAWSTYSEASANLLGGYPAVVSNGFLYFLGDNDYNASATDAVVTSCAPVH